MSKLRRTKIVMIEEHMEADAFGGLHLKRRIRRIPQRKQKFIQQVLSFMDQELQMTRPGTRRGLNIN